MIRSTMSAVQHLRLFLRKPPNFKGTAIHTQFLRKKVTDHVSLLLKRQSWTNDQMPRKWISRSAATVFIGFCTTRIIVNSSVSWIDFLKWTRFYAHCHQNSFIQDTAPEERQLYGHQSQRKSIIITLFDKLYLGLILILRSARIFLKFVPLLCLYPFTLLNHRVRTLWWWLLLVATETSGPSFIKLGQWASTRRDLFSSEFCDRFSKLHRWVKSHNWCFTETKLVEAFGPNWQDFFVVFDKTSKPVGSGCIAQVYRALLNPEKIPDSKLKTEMLRRREDRWNLNLNKNTRQLRSGIPVAVKVCHPGIREAFSHDLAIMKTMANILTFCFPSLRWLSLIECVQEFAVLMEKQIDLHHEAQCLDRFHDNFSSHNCISVARPVWPLVSAEVLVESFEDGEHISNFLLEKEYPSGLREKLACLGIDALLKMVFVDNFVHGDLHPGNILVQNADGYVSTSDKANRISSDTNSPSKDLRLILLDVGITASMSEVDKKKFTDVFRAVVLGKGEEVAELFLTQTRYSECRDPENFKREMTELVKAARSETFKLGTVTVGELLSQVFGLLSNYKLKMESNFASIILAIAVLEGLGRSLHPELDVLERAKPFLLSAAWKK